MTTSVGHSRRSLASSASAFVATAIVAAAVLSFGSAAGAATSPAVPMGTARNYSVLGASTVTNTGSSVLHLNLGVSPGTAITGFPPGLVVPPANTNRANAVAAQAQADLTAAYLNAAGRSIDATTTSNLANKHLLAGVYAGPSKSALSLTGPLVLDGAGDPSSVFIFQTNSTLVTASASTVELINGAQACNVFWQVGSSATLGSGSVFAGNIMALASVTVNNGVTVHGRALARTGAVTLINDRFLTPTCAVTPEASPAPTSTTAAPGTPGTPGGDSGTGGGSATPGVNGPPRTDAISAPTGTFPWTTVLFVGLLAATATGATALNRRRIRLQRVSATRAR